MDNAKHVTNSTVAPSGVVGTVIACNFAYSWDDVALSFIIRRRTTISRHQPSLRATSTLAHSARLTILITIPEFGRTRRILIGTPQLAPHCH